MVVDQPSPPVSIGEIIDTCPKDIVIANALTPNDDGYNDFFHIINIEYYPDNQIKIYNRWGDLIYKKDGYLNDWDGKLNGNLLPTGTYYYVLNLNDGSEDYKGYVMILE